IVGQCTAPPAHGALGGGVRAPALSAGCGVADTLAIRTNCCALISLLASAVLAKSTTTTTNDAATTENVDATPHLREGVASSPEQNGSGESGGCEGGRRRKSDPPLVPAAPGSGGGDDWGAFVPMSAEPNPDVVSVVRKKGWAARHEARQQLPFVQPLAAGAAAVKTNSRHLRVPGPGGRIKMTSRRSRQSVGTARSSEPPDFSRNTRNRASELPIGSSRQKRSGLPVDDLAMSPGKAPKGQRQDRAELSPTCRRGKGRHQSGGRGSGRGRIDDIGRGGAAAAEGSPPSNARKLSHRHHHHHHREPVPDGLTSPPRLRRIKGREVPALAPSSSDLLLQPGGPRGANGENGVGPLGLSDPRNAKRIIPPKVWHTVSVSPRKSRREKAAGEHSPPAITLATGKTSERFRTQPPVRQAVIFGSDLVREEEFDAFWGKGDDGIAVDAKLGYQVPRLWFPHARPGQAGAHIEERAPASAGVSMPEPRPKASGGADLPIGSDAVVQEYQQMQAFRAYSALAHARPSSADPIHGADANTALVSALGRRPEEDDAAIAEEWSPRRGRRPTRSRVA
ncbi:unnamed protein product, partial [Scytosiphon promiscuus]